MKTVGNEQLGGKGKAEREGPQGTRGWQPGIDLSPIICIPTRKIKIIHKGKKMT